MYISEAYRIESLKPLTVGGAGDPPSTRYWGLRYNSGSGGVELSATGGYARVSMTTSTFWTQTEFDTGDPAYVNAAALTFGTPSADWGYYNELALYDGSGDTTPVMVFDIYDAAGARAIYGRDGIEQVFAAGEVVVYNYIPYDTGA